MSELDRGGHPALFANDAKGKECATCGRELYYRYRENPRDRVSFARKDLPDPRTDYPEPHVHMRKETVIEFRNSYAELGEFASYVCGKSWKDLCLADMMFYVRRMDAIEQENTFLKAQVAKLKKEAP